MAAVTRHSAHSLDEFKTDLETSSVRRRNALVQRAQKVTTSDALEGGARRRFLYLFSSELSTSEIDV
jgi:hypothetical protein